jgi:hypothetical protein
MNQIYKDSWRNYLRLGLIPLPAPPHMKGPTIGWADYQQDPPCSDEYLEWEDKFSNYNVWLLLGDQFVCIDPDHPDAETFIQSLKLPEAPTSISGGKSIHRWLKTSPPIEPIIIKKDGKMWLEVRTGSLGMMAPPSIHPETKRPYRWEEGHSPWEIPFPDLPVEAYEKIKMLSGNGSNPNPRSADWAQELLQGIPDGDRNVGLAQLAGRYVAKGLSREEILPILEAVNSKSIPPKPEKEVQTTLDSVFKTHHRNHPATSPEDDSRVKRSGYNLIQGQVLLEMEEQETHWLWEGILIAGGLSWLVSKPKVGKSVTSLNLAVCVSRGEPFLGKNTTQGFVIYLALEESQEEVRKNLIKMGGDFTNIYFHFGMAPQDALHQLIILMEEKKPVLVIIDIAQKFLRAKKIEDYAEAISKLEPLNEMARKCNCQVILTGHAPKIDRELIDSILGSTGYSGSVDTVMGIRKDRNGRRSFSTIQRYHKSGQPDIENWVLKLDNNEITIELAGLIHEVNIRDAKEQILGVLRNIGKGKFYSEPMSESQIRDEIKKDKQFTLNCLKELYQEGRILRNGEGKRNSPYRYSV